MNDSELEDRSIQSRNALKDRFLMHHAVSKRDKVLETRLELRPCISGNA